MKKQLQISVYILAFFTFFISGAFAQFVSLEKAKDVAVAAFNERKPANREVVGITAIKSELLEKNKGVTVYYIFNFSGNAFFIVAADHRISPILGYSFEGMYNPQNTPDCMQWLFSDYSQQIYDVVSKNISVKDTEIAAEWEKYENVSLQKSNPTPLPSLMSVAPLMTTIWSQGCFYNEACPEDATLGTTRCGRVPTGCVATAMSQIMKYHNYPTQGTGSNSINSNYGTLSADFGTTTYNWSNMPNEVLSANADVAQLLYHTGVALYMDYNANNSSARVFSLRDALIDYFKYANTAKLVYKVDYTNTQWNSLIKTEIDAQRVVEIGGKDQVTNSGHSFVADGYQGSNSFHINWGWGGMHNGYFLLSALNPNSNAYNVKVSATIGIKPIAITSNCSMVNGLSTSSITSTSATLNWASGTGGSSNTFNVKYKKTSNSTWTTVTATANSKAITGLTPGTAYHFQVQRVCGGTSTSNFSSSTTFTTLPSSSSGTTVTIGTGTSTTGVAPYGTANMDERVQFIITKSELVAGGYTSATNYIKSLAFNVAAANSKVLNAFTIKVGHTTASSFSSTSFLTTTLTTVFSNYLSAVNGWNTYTFDTPFLYNGSSNLLIQICWNNSSTAGNSTVRQTITSVPRTLYLKSNNSTGSVCAAATGLTTTNRPNMRFTFSATALKMADATEEIATEEAIELFEKEVLSMKVFPNPTADYATIEITGTLEPTTQLTVFDVTGKQVFEDEMRSNSYQLAVGNYTPGIYLVVIKSGKHLLNKKIIINKDL